MSKEIAIKFAELAKEYHKIRSRSVIVDNITIENMELVFDETIDKECVPTRSVLYANFITGEIIWSCRQDHGYINFRGRPEDFIDTQNYAERILFDDFEAGFIFEKAVFSIINIRHIDLKEEAIKAYHAKLNERISSSAKSAHVKK